jgi:hypothetical protein
VRFDFSAVPRSAGSSSPVIELRRASPCAAVPRRRRFGTPQLGSHARALRLGANPAANGAPQCRFEFAPPLAAARRRASLAAGSTPPLPRVRNTVAARSQPDASDRATPPVKPACTGQRIPRRSNPPQ